MFYSRAAVDLNGRMQELLIRLAPSSWVTRPFVLIACLSLAVAVFFTPVYAQEPAASSGMTADQARAISELLSNEATRDALVRELDSIASGGAVGHTDAAQQADAETQVSFGRRIAEVTQDTAERLAARAVNFSQRFAQLPRTLSRLSNISSDVLRQAVVDLILVIAGTALAFILLRTWAKRLYRHMGQSASGSRALRTGAIIGASVIVDATVVVVAWAAGYALALLALGEAGSIGIRQHCT